MALYGLIWLEIAFADNTSLPGAQPGRSARGSSNCQVPGSVEARFSRSGGLPSVVQGLVLNGWDQPELTV
jgi:hypothetical protein